MHHILKLAASLAIVGAALLLQPATADAGATDKSSSDKAQPKDPSQARVKWKVHAIELSTKKGNPFRGRVVLRSGVKQHHSLLSYYWGGKCKGTKLARSRLDLLMLAMRKGYAVEIPGFPIKYQGAVVMCMQSVRVINE